MCVAEDVGAELFVDVGEGTKSTDGMVEHLHCRGNAFFIAENIVRFNP